MNQKEKIDNAIVHCPLGGCREKQAACYTISSLENHIANAHLAQATGGMSDDPLSEEFPSSCEFCGDVIHHKGMDTHRSLCRKACNTCASYPDTFDRTGIEYTQHRESCLIKTAPCPHCNTLLQQQDIQDHIDTECILKVSQKHEKLLSRNSTPEAIATAKLMTTITSHMVERAKEQKKINHEQKTLNTDLLAAIQSLRDNHEKLKTACEQALQQQSSSLSAQCTQLKESLDTHERVLVAKFPDLANTTEQQLHGTPYQSPQSTPEALRREHSADYNHSVRGRMYNNPDPQETIEAYQPYSDVVEQDNLESATNSFSPPLSPWDIVLNENIRMHPYNLSNLPENGPEDDQARANLVYLRHYQGGTTEFSPIYLMVKIPNSFNSYGKVQALPQFQIIVSNDAQQNEVTPMSVLVSFQDSTLQVTLQSMSAPLPAPEAHIAIPWMGFVKKDGLMIQQATLSVDRHLQDAADNKIYTSQSWDESLFDKNTTDLLILSTGSDDYALLGIPYDSSLIGLNISDSGIFQEFPVPRLDATAIRVHTPPSSERDPIVPSPKRVRSGSNASLSESQYSTHSNHSSEQDEQ